jgi:hypothetical protein
MIKSYNCFFNPNIHTIIQSVASINKRISEQIPQSEQIPHYEQIQPVNVANIVPNLIIFNRYQNMNKQTKSDSVRETQLDIPTQDIPTPDIPTPDIPIQDIPTPDIPTPISSAQVETQPVPVQTMSVQTMSVQTMPVQTMPKSKSEVSLLNPTIHMKKMFRSITTTSGLFEKITTNNYIQNGIIKIGNQYGNTLNKLVVDTNNMIVQNSNEWLHLLKYNYPMHSIYYHILELYNNILLDMSNNNYRYIDETVIDFTTSFSTGTAHGYSGLFNLIEQYQSHHTDKKIIVYKNSQNGVLQLIEHLIGKTYGSDRIIYIEQNQTYVFQNIVCIQNIYHEFDHCLINKTREILTKQIIYSDEIFNNKYGYPNCLDKICIIKSTNTENITTCGMADSGLVNKYCQKQNYKLIDPSSFNEIDFANILYRCSELTVSWGTAFFKNYHYLSEKCNMIRVLVFDHVYIGQYNNALVHNALLNKYQNANISYNVVSNINHYLEFA